MRRAIEQFQIVTQKEPKDADSWVMLGRLYQVSNKSPEAEKAFNAALAADRGQRRGPRRSGQAVHRSRRQPARRREAEGRSPTSRPTSGRSPLLAQQYEDLQQYKEAADILKKLRDLAPTTRRSPRRWRGT